VAVTTETATTIEPFLAATIKTCQVRKACNCLKQKTASKPKPCLPY